MAVGGTIGAAIAGWAGLTAGTTAYTVAAVAINIAVAAAISAGASAIAAKMASEGPNKASRTANLRQPLAPHEVVYGTVRKGGIVTYVNGTGLSNSKLHMVLMLASHPCEAIDAVYLNGNPVPLQLVAAEETSPGVWNIRRPYLNPELGPEYDMWVPLAGSKYGRFASFAYRLGSPTQDAIPGMLMECDNWSAAHQAKGRTFIYSRLIMWNEVNVWPSFVPAITCRMNGKNDIYDPRSDDEGWTDNPALIVADILESYLGVPRARIDQASLIEAANICDQTVAKKGGGTEKRYRACGFFALEGEPEGWLVPIVNAMAGAVIEHHGTYYIRAGAWRAPVITITDADIMGSIKLRTAESDRDRANVARGMFASAESHDQPTDFPQIVDADAVEEDGGVEQAMEVNLEFAPSHRQAQRVARIMLRTQRFGRTLELATNLLKGLDVRPWDNVTLNLTALGISGTFRVIEHRMSVDGDPPALRPVLTLREVASSIYDWTAATDEQDLKVNVANIPGGDLELKDLESTTTVHTSGSTFKPATLDLSWLLPPDVAAEAIEAEAIVHFQWRVGAGAWNDEVLEVQSEVAWGSTSTALDIINPDMTGGPWSFQAVQIERVRVRARVAQDAWSEWTEIQGDLSAPVAVSKTLTPYTSNADYHKPAKVKGVWTAPTQGTVSRYEMEAKISYEYRVGTSGAYTPHTYIESVTTSSKSLERVLWDKSFANGPTYQFQNHVLDYLRVRSRLADGTVSEWTDL